MIESEVVSQGNVPLLTLAIDGIEVEQQSHLARVVARVESGDHVGVVSEDAVRGRPQGVDGSGDEGLIPAPDVTLLVGHVLRGRQPVDVLVECRLPGLVSGSAGMSINTRCPGNPLTRLTPCPRLMPGLYGSCTGVIGIWSNSTLSITAVSSCAIDLLLSVSLLRVVCGNAHNG